MPSKKRQGMTCTAQQDVALLPLAAEFIFLSFHFISFVNVLINKIKLITITYKEILTLVGRIRFYCLRQLITRYHVPIVTVPLAYYCRMRLSSEQLLE
jgi:hypothetical protein